MSPRTSLLRALLVPVGLWASLSVADARAAGQTAGGAGARQATAGDVRVVATITTLECTVRIAGVDADRHKRSRRYTSNP